MVCRRKEFMMLLIISTFVVSEALVIPSEILKEVVTALVAIVMLFAEVLELAAIVILIVLVHLFSVFRKLRTSLRLDLNVLAAWFCAEVCDALKESLLKMVVVAIRKHLLVRIETESWIHDVELRGSHYGRINHISIYILNRLQ